MVYDNRRKELVEQALKTLKDNTDYNCELFTAEDEVHDESNYIKLRNKLISEIPFDYEYFVHLDDDLFFSKGWLTKMVQASKDNPDVWQVAGTTWFKHERIEERKTITITNINVGGCLLITKDAWMKVGPWQEDKKKTYVHCERIQKAGGKIAFMNDNTLVVHCGINGIIPTRGHAQWVVEEMQALCDKVGAISNL